MGRPGGPWWWRARRRWAATIGGTRVVAPATIREGDRASAWAWYAAESAEAASPRSAAVVADVFNAHLARLRDRVAAGDLAADTFGTRVSTLRTACGVVVGGSCFGGILAADLDLRKLQGLAHAWAARPGLRGGDSRVSPSYLATGLAYVRAALRWAARPDDGREPLLTSDPTVGWRLPAARRAEVEICDRREAAAWLRWCRRRATKPGRRDFARLQRLLIATGARPSELTRATWADVRWDAGRTPSGNVRGVIERRDWKNARTTGKVRRIVLLPRSLRILRRLRDRIKPTPGDRIFLSLSGKPWTAGSLASATAAYREAARAAGVDLGGLESEGPARSRGYLWRHVAASRLVMAGVDLSTIGELLGTSAAMIERTYGHLKDDHVADAAGLLSGRGR